MGSATQSPHVPPAGVWVPSITYFDNASDTIDFDAQKAHFKYLASTGLTGLVIIGTNSESFLLTREERRQLIAAARETVGPGYPLMAGVGAHSTKQVIELADDAHKAGADYLLVLPPAYFGKATTMNVVKRFFAELSSKVALPIVIYNFPAVTNGVDIDSETITAIVRESAANSPDGKSKVVGVKLTCGSVGKISRLSAEHKPEDFAIFGGQSDFLIGGLAAGSSGCIAGFGNVFPRLTLRIYQLWKEGKHQEALDLQRKQALAESPCKSGISSVKFAVSHYTAGFAGIQDAEAKLSPRHPYEPVPEPARKAVRTTMAEAAEIEKSLMK